MTHLILASASPRRQEFLRLLGIPFRALPTNVDERALPGELPERLVARVSALKAAAAAQQVEGVILAADTVVVLDGRVLGKPRNEDDARRMLLALRNRWHVVYTAVTVGRAQGGVLEDARTVVDAARVHMRAYSDEEIDAYIATGDPLDKAGAYAIQNVAFRPVDRVDGCRATVMGLPIARLLPLLARQGIPLPEDPTRACRHIFGACCLDDGEVLGEG